MKSVRIMPTTTWFSTYRTGGLEGLTAADIVRALNFEPNVEDDADKVVNSWRCYVDGSPFAVWDYKGSHFDNRWSVYDPDHKATEIFPLANVSKF